MRVVAIGKHDIIPEARSRMDSSLLPSAHQARLDATGGARLADIDAAGTDVQVLSVVLPMPQMLPAETAVPLAAKVNGELHAMVTAPHGVQFYGRRTWEHFAKLWPGRDGDYARAMNTVPKRVATRIGIDAAAWTNSAAIDGDPVAWVTHERERRAVVVIGSLSLVHALAAADLIDEYRLITFPAIVGEGERLFATGTPADFRFTTVELADAGTLTIMRRDRTQAAAARR